MTIRAALKLADARKEAKAILGRVAKGADPLIEHRRAKASASHAATLQGVCETFLVREGGMKITGSGKDRKVTFEGGKLRTAAERYATFERLVFPKLGKRPIDEIKRSEINALLNKIEDERGTAMADHTLAYLRRVFNWHAAVGSNDDFRSPIVRGMSRGTSNKRSRILDDDEVRGFWRGALAWEKAAGEYGHPFPRLLRFAFLTATRRDEAADMVWSEIDNDAYDVWLIPAARYKTKLDFEVPLSGVALGILHEARRIKLGTYVFTTNGNKPISNFSDWKNQFDAFMLAELRKIAVAYCGSDEGVELVPWTIHDLRRTARSLMSQARVEPDHAERALGHTIGGVRGVYDRHAYREEKRSAFEALAARIDHILRTVRW
jgi:integrase